MKPRPAWLTLAWLACACSSADAPQGWQYGGKISPLVDAAFSVSPPADLGSGSTRSTPAVPAGSAMTSGSADGGGSVRMDAGAPSANGRTQDAGGDTALVQDAGGGTPTFDASFSGSGGSGSVGSGDGGSGGASGTGGATGSGGANGSGGDGGSGGSSGNGGQGGAGSGGTGGMGGSGGTGGGGGSVADAGCAGDPADAGTAAWVAPSIPAPGSACPTLATGTITVQGQQVALWVGAKQSCKKGAVFFYWHGTGGTSDEARYGLGSVLDEITSEGGLVASFTTTTGNGQNTGNGVWYTGDFAMADFILACAVQQLDVDPRRVYTGGCSAGGLQASAMVYGRSSYLAAAMPNSGGIIFGYGLQNSHVPALITAHGAMGTDVVSGLDFSTTSLNQCKDIAAKGGFAVDCDHGGNHCGAPAELIVAQWTFLKAHPFGVTPEPYAAGLPSGFPSYCSIIH